MEIPKDTITVMGLALLGVFSFYLALTETALMALSKDRVKEWKAQGKRIALLLEALIENRKKLLGFFESFQMFLAALYFSLLTLYLYPFLQARWSVTPFILYLAGFFSYVLLFQFFPRRLALHYVEKTALLLSPPIMVLFKLLGWIDTVLDGFSSILANLFGRESPLKKQPLSDEELKMLVSLGKDEPLDIQEEEKEMIESVMTFGQTLVKEIMTPRIDMVCVEINTTVSGVLDMAISHGHLKFPVYERTIDNIIGIVYVKDLLCLVRDSENTKSLRELLRKPFFVPESKKVDDLLRDMQKEKISMAIIVDEYGGTDGLVTIEDIVEEIVGEIADEHDLEAPPILQLGENTWLLDGQVNIEDLNAQLELNFPTEEFETLAGYLYSHMGKVPKSGDKIETEGEILEVTVVHRQRISKVKLTKKARSLEEKVKEELS